MRHSIKVTSIASLFAAGVCSPACVPQVNVTSDYRSHLTKAENTQLENGQIVEKTHVSYWRFKSQQIYWVGPLAVKKDPAGKLLYTPHGDWKRYNRNGTLDEETHYTTNRIYARNYDEQGVLWFDAYEADTVLNGQSTQSSTYIYFRNGNGHDTMSVSRAVYPKGKRKPISQETILFDAEGRRINTLKIK